MAKLVFDTENAPQKLKNSLFCGFKGFFIFNLAAITMLESSLYNTYSTGYRQQTANSAFIRAKHQLKNHIVPFLEVITVMPLLFLLTHYFGDKMFGTSSTATRYAACILACMLVMILICLTLRLLGQRKDPCCGVIMHPIYRSNSAHTNDFIYFRGPNYHTSTNSTAQETSNTSRIILSILISLLLTPFFLLKSAIELACCVIEALELPISFLFDLCNLLQDTVQDRTGYHVIRGPRNTDRFTYSRKTINNLSSFLYAGLRDLIVGCSLGILNANIIEQHGDLVSPISLLDNTLLEAGVLNTTSRT